MTIAEGMMISYERFKEIDKRVEELFLELDTLSEVTEQVITEVQDKRLGETHTLSEYEREIALVGYSVGATVVAKKVTKTMAELAPLVSAARVILSKGKMGNVEENMLRAALDMVLDSGKND
jgi:predicted alpha/beta-fold hydrolase